MSNRTDYSPNTAMTVVSLAVLLSTSTWFSGTAVRPALIAAWGLSDVQAAWLTISVQLGFVVGTLLYSLLNIADIYNARRVFLVSALLGAGFNALFGLVAREIVAAVVFRFLTGVTLAGIYPVGMKIIASWFRSGLGWRLGVMVAAITLGTASPYLIRGLGSSLTWSEMVLIASAAAAIGGILMATALPDGPYLKGRSRFDARMLVKVFANRPFRCQAIGYFGHMWELYAFWVLVTLYLQASFESHGVDRTSWLPWCAFSIIGVGGLGCVVGGWISRRTGERAIALVSLIVSGTLCAVSPMLFLLDPPLLVAICLVWGVFVVADSPQFSALAARHCPPEYTGTALTVQNGIGFAVTVVSIHLVSMLADSIGWRWVFVFLTPGPMIGAWYMWRMRSAAQPATSHAA
ncbi:MAG: MFS transporter [Planctomycetes bacterium]|nr:MFS transporter [Planctomycetota bacterium]